MKTLLKAGLVAALALGLGTAAGAATVNVTAVVDEADGSCTDGDCSLRDAVSSALPGDTVSVPAGTYVLTLGQISIDKNLILTGAGARSTILDGNATSRIFRVGSSNQSAIVAISDLTLRNGKGTEAGGFVGGGIANAATLTITRCTITNNDAPGGGLYNTGNLVIQESAVVGNQSDGNGGGILSYGSLTLVNSTVSGNTALNYGAGGGIVQVGLLSTPVPLTVINSTISSNVADPAKGGGMVSGNVELNLVNTIISGNTGGDCRSLDVVQTSDHSLDSDGTCGLTGPGDLSGVDSLLGPLADNGGPTDTHALLAGSPAIDAGSGASCPATDQRGVTRPQGPECDIGAFEAGVEPPACVVASGEVARWQADGDAMDSIGNNDGTLLNGAGFGPGLRDQAFVFDGVDDYVSVPDSAPLSLTTTFTLAAWIKPVDPANGNIQAVVAKPRAVGGTGFSLALANGIAGLAMNNGGLNCVAASTLTIPAGQWTHIAGTFGASTAKVYINGVLAGTAACPFASIQDSGEPLVIGRELETLGRYYQGAVDHVQIFNHDLTAAEIQGLVDGCEPNVAPVALCRDVTASAGSACTASASIDNGSYDPDGSGAADSITLLTQAPPPPYPLGATEVTLTATDDFGASSSCTGTVTVVETTPPLISCPANITVDGNLALGGATVPFTVSALDSCDASVSVLAMPGSGRLFLFGTTTVTATATDDSGNSAQCTFTVTVLTPGGQVTELLGEIDALIAAGALTANNASPLISKLEGAVAKIGSEEVTAACNQLGAFINQVNAYISSGILTPAQGQALIEPVQAIQANTCSAPPVTCPCVGPTGEPTFTAIVSGTISILGCETLKTADEIAVKVPGASGDFDASFSMMIDGVWVCGTQRKGTPDTATVITPEEGLYCSSLLEQAANNQSVACVPHSPET